MARPWIELEIPKLREGSYFPDFLLEPRRRAERALVSVVEDLREDIDLLQAKQATFQSGREVADRLASEETARHRLQIDLFRLRSEYPSLALDLVQAVDGPVIMVTPLGGDPSLALGVPKSHSEGYAEFLERLNELCEEASNQ